MASNKDLNERAHKKREAGSSPLKHDEGVSQAMLVRFAKDNVCWRQQRGYRRLPADDGELVVSLHGD